MLLTHVHRRCSGNSCVVRVQIHETGTAAWIAHLQLCGSYRSTATATTRAQVFHLPLHREDALRHDVASMAWVCRVRSSTGFICKALGRRAACASTCDGLREAAPVARGREVRLRAALRAPELVSAGPRRTSRSPRVVRGPGRAPRRAGGTGARRRVRRDGRVADARRAAGAGPVEGRGDPAPRPRNDEMRSLDGDARFTSMPPASTVRARPLDGSGGQRWVSRTRWLVTRHRLLYEIRYMCL